MKYPTLSFLVFLPILSACHPKHSPVLVHIFRDHDGAIGENLDAAIRAISLRQLTMPDGSPVVVATFEFRSYEQALPAIGRKHRPDIAIFNSRADYLRVNLGGAPINLQCAPNITCVAVIPDWTTGKDREASERVLSMISSDLGGSLGTPSR